MMDIKPLRLMGRCANGYERDGGKKYHAVDCPDGYPLEKALCGATYGRHSAGWSMEPGFLVTCPRCLKRLANLKA